MGLDTLSMKDLLASGVHFGHKVSRWNPKMRPFIFGKSNSVHIIDIKQTVKGLVKACRFAKNIAKRGDLILFVGTKRQACNIVRTESKRCGMPYVSERWLGGSLTNYKTVRGRLKRLNEIEQWETDGTINRYTKKEISGIMREKRRLVRNLDGLRVMDRLPTAIVIVDPMHERIAVDESNKIGAVAVALIDTDGDPDRVDIAIPGNDDSMKVIQIIIGKIADAVLDGKAEAIGTTQAIEPKTADQPAAAAAAAAAKA
ncbi:MAG: 30S ribosomal protein S2 [Planctomycetes bacterium RBG_16_59_8]|nr:MAG: 30S ribosomal protein S2 [Planctomycetes bacterium RBG_16_59_8]